MYSAEQRTARADLLEELHAMFNRTPDCKKANALLRKVIRTEILYMGREMNMGAAASDPTLCVREEATRKDAWLSAPANWWQDGFAFVCMLVFFASMALLSVGFAQ